MRWLKVSIATAAVLPTLFFGAVAWTRYHAAWQDAQAQTERAASIAHQHVERVIETNAVITRKILELLGDRSDDEIRAAERDLHEKLRTTGAELEQVQSIWVWDAHGRPLASNRFYPVPDSLSVADRGYFQWHRDARGGFYVSRPLIGRTTGEAFFDITHRRESSDGRFLGVISVSLRPSYFVEFYRDVAADSAVTLLLFRKDGSVLVRWPDPTGGRTVLLPDGVLMQALQTRQSRLTVHGLSGIDHQDRLASLRVLERFPVVVSASLAGNAILAQWYRDLLLLAVFAFPTAFGLVYVSWVAMRRTRRELHAVQRLKEESAQRERAEQALRQAQKLEALGRLSGGVAHDFNNLLMVVNNNLHLLSRLHPDTAGSAQLGAIDRAVQNGVRLTRQLLAFSRHQALHAETVDLSARIASLLDLLRTTLGPGIHVAAQIDDAVPPVLVDAAELELAMLNLAINARDAISGTGEFRIHVRVAAHGEVDTLTGGPFVAVDVSDTGRGIEPELLEKVFEPFFTTKGPNLGTGLGLSQVYGLCAQMGGTARIASELGVGTTVTLLLPAAPVRTEAVAAQAADPPIEPLCGSVLLVEDNAAVAAATEPLLAELGCEVRHAPNGEQALALIEAAPDQFDYVLSDVVMPGALNGIDLALQLRARHPRIAVVLMTGYAAEIQRAIDADLRVLTKPFSPAAMSVALAAARRAADAA
ncbi:MAG TPA: ATP-binding protein [Burkholderiaceae bacterium]|jgi:two-component system, NtrC family, sensor kinase|nr:ATP-binding protein [Burkholderiaceae bacterium]